VKKLINVDAKDLAQAVALLKPTPTGPQAVVVSGGSDLLRMIKHDLVAPDKLINLKSVKGLDKIQADATGVRIGALVTLSTIAADPTIKSKYTCLAEAAASVATPQVRNAGTIGGNLAQRPWCWYFRNALFNCLRKGGKQCYGANGENEHHAIFAGGPCFMIHPSDTATALVALNGSIRIMGPAGERTVPVSSFFTTPDKDIKRENVLGPGEIIAGVTLPAAAAGEKSVYKKVMDRGTWDHAVVSLACVVNVSAGVCNSARIVLGGVAPTPWRVAAAEKLLVGQKVTPEQAVKVGAAAVRGAHPLKKNEYKVKVAQALVSRTVSSLA